MNAAEFAGLEEVQGVLERASRAAGTALSVHAIGQDDGDTCLFSSNARTACRYVNALARGEAACRRDRETAAADAVRHGGTIPFICHMGFACVCAPLPDSQLGLAITLGPYCPSEGAEALELDARRGLRAVEMHERERLPFALCDIPITSATVFPAILAWMQETLRAMWESARKDKQTEEDELEDHGTALERRRRPARKGAADVYQAGPIAAALSGGAQEKVRDLVASALAEGRAPARRRPAAQRARAIALVASVLELSEQAGLICDPCWEGFEEFVETVRRSGSDLRLADAVMALLGTLKRTTARAVPKAPEYAELNRLVLGRLEEGVMLEEVASVLGVHPTAITHRLQRHFGMSFGEYVGRLRVDKAKELLRRTKLPVGDVARRVGIQDASNFGKVFRRFERMSPLAYRGQFGKEK